MAASAVKSEKRNRPLGRVRFSGQHLCLADSLDPSGLHSRRRLIHVVADGAALLICSLHSGRTARVDTPFPSPTFIEVYPAAQLAALAAQPPRLDRRCSSVAGSPGSSRNCAEI